MWAYLDGVCVLHSVTCGAVRVAVWGYRWPSMLCVWHLACWQAALHLWHTLMCGALVGHGQRLVYVLYYLEYHASKR